MTLVPDDSLAGGEAEQHEQDGPDLAAAEALFGPVARAGDRLLLLLESREQRRLAEPDADEERDDEEQRAEDERVPPADAREVGGGHGRAEVQDDREREEETERRGGLDPRRIQAALVVGRVLCDVDRGAAVLATKCKALDQPQDHEADRREDANVLVCR